MAKDSLLQEKFFYFLSGDEDLTDSLQREKVEIQNLIKQSLYPQGQEPVYYQGRYNNFKDLNDFIEQPEYIELQRQLTLIIEKLKAWGRDHELSNLEKTLADFLVKLKLTGVTEKITVLWGDGKKSLEIIAVLLNDPQIDLELRKTIFIDLLADNELAKCIDGCYTRISNAAEKLLEHRDSKNQINRWISNYCTDKARKIAAKRPIAMPESYQRLICRTLNIPFRTNELHASNYLLNQAKEKGFAINLIPDTGAIEIGQQLDYINRREVVNLYLAHLESKVTASDLVNFISRRLHADFKQIMEDKDRNYVEKIATIETKLQLIGRDNRFLLNEIFEVELGELKPASSLTITIQNRLTQRNWLYPVEKKSFELSGQRFYYYYFPRNLELNWYFQEGDTTRSRFIELLNPDYLNTENSIKTSLLLKFLDLPDFIVHSREILTVLKYNKLSFPIIDFLPDNGLIECLSRISDPLRFSQIIKSLSLEKGESILKKMNKLNTLAMISKAMNLADVEARYDYLPSDYFIQHYNQLAQEDVLKLTKQFLMNLIEKGFRDFSDHVVFINLKHTNYLIDIDFSGSNLINAAFMQPISSCSFEGCTLTNTVFQKNLKFVSFAEVNLQSTIFFTHNLVQYENLNLRNAKLSTSVFADFLTAGITDFSYSDLSSIDFQIILSDKKLALDLSYTNLQGVDLSGLNLKNIKFYSSDMSFTKLIGSIIRPVNFQNIVIQGAYLSLEMANDFHEQGINQFDKCLIYQEGTPDVIRYFTFHKVSFKKTIFENPLPTFQMLECDLTEARFTSENTINYDLFPKIKFKKTKFIKTEFQDIKITDLDFTDCIIEDLKFLNVKLTPNSLFKFYSLGHRDFTQVKELKGRVTEKLTPFSLYEAVLSKEVFIHLYKQGIRDFRASNLKSFYLGQVLREQAISSINLKLGGATYRKSLLSCATGARKPPKRSTSFEYCEFTFIIQKQGLFERQLSLEDIRKTFQASTLLDMNFVLEEIVLDQPSLFLLKNPKKINFYWGYIPQEERSFEQIIKLIIESTSRADRSKSQIEFYFTQKISSIDTITRFAGRLISLGFTSGYINYFNIHGQLLASDLKGKSINLVHHSEINKKLIDISHSKKNIQTFHVFEKEQRSRFYRIAADMQRRSKTLLRSGIREGAHYEIGHVVMYLVSRWLMQRETPKPQLLDIDTKNKLKKFAKEIIKKEADSKRVGRYIRDLLERVASLCIERGECYNEALVQEDIVNNLNDIKQDIQVGYDIMWDKLKDLFISISKFFAYSYPSMQGYFLSKSTRLIKRNVLEDLKEINTTLIQSTQINTDKDVWTTVSSNFSTIGFSAHSNACLINQSWFDPDEIKTSNTSNGTVAPVTVNHDQSIEFILDSIEVARRTNREVYDWSENSLILRLIKTIIICFDVIGFDLNQDTQFSEAKLACLMYDIGLVLDRCAITHTSPKDILNLFHNPLFWQEVFNRSERYDFVAPRTEFSSVEWTENKFSEDSLDVLELANQTLIKKKQRRHIQFLDISGMNEFIHGASSSANKSTFWLANWVFYLFRNILAVKEMIWPSAPLPQYYPDITFYNKKTIYPQTKQLTHQKSPLQIFFNNFEINNFLILADFFLKCYVSPQPKKKNKLKMNKHFIRDLKAIIIASARENNIRLSDVYSPWLLKNLTDTQSYYCNENDRVKDQIFICRNKLYQTMDFKKLTTVKKFRFLNSFDLNVNNFFFTNETFYPTDFLFFKKQLENSDLYFTDSNQSLVLI